MSKIEIDELKELFAEWGLWSLVDDISDDGDGHGDNLQLTKEGLEAERMIDRLLEEKIVEVLHGLKLKLNGEIDKLLGEERDEDN
jgi:hypothetical protein